MKIVDKRIGSDADQLYQVSVHIALIVRNVQNIDRQEPHPYVNKCLPSAIRTVTTIILRQTSLDQFRLIIERLEMRSILLCIILVVGFSAPAYCQQLKSITNSIGIKLVLIHAGSFTMGSPVSEEGRSEDETPHEVTINKSYYLGAFEVTLGQYEKVMGENSTFLLPLKGDRGLYPVTSIKWDDSVLFCRKLSELPDEKAVGRQYRLPTEAEWEYACRATSTTAYCFGDSTESPEEYAWFGEGQAGQVGAGQPAIQLDL